jgi:glyoxylate reductase
LPEERRERGCGNVLVESRSDEELVRLLENPRRRRRRLRGLERDTAVDSRPRTLDNVVLRPHTSSATIEGRHRDGRSINIKTFANRRRPPGFQLML